MNAARLWLDEVDSTNAEAGRRAEAGEGGPLWIAARRQTAGRGRRGRSWSSAEDNLAATLLITVDRTPHEAAGISFVAALAVADLAGAYVPENLVRLKWPNDVLVAGRKASGVLIESGPAASSGLWLAVGIGVNLASYPPDVERPATALAEHLSPQRAAPPRPEAALDVLASSFERWMGPWRDEGLTPILEAWTARSSGIPGPCSVRLESGTLDGEAEGLDSEGRLRLRSPDGRERLIAAGDVFFPGA